MRKFILLSAMAIMGSASVIAQSLTINPKQFTMAGPNSEKMDGVSAIKNVSSDVNDTVFQWSIIEYSVESSWMTSYCDPKDCYTALVQGFGRNFILRNNKNSSFIASFVPQENSGNGSMTVVVKSVKYPQNIDTLTYTANAWVTGVSTVNKNSKLISFYPNPVKDQLYFNFPAKGTVNVDIYNVLGTKVRTFTHDGNTSTFNVSDLQNGVYFIRVNDKGNLYSKSFTKSE